MYARRHSHRRQMRSYRCWQTDVETNIAFGRVTHLLFGRSNVQMQMCKQEDRAKRSVWPNFGQLFEQQLTQFSVRSIIREECKSNRQLCYIL